MPTPDKRLVEALLREDFESFLRRVFGTLAPGQTYVPNWHIAAIAYQLERVRRGEIRRLIINMPPRSLKSIAASVAFPAFMLGHDPTRRIICVSYSGDLARKHSNDFRAVIEAPWYRSLFPTTRIGPFKNSETEIELTARGFRLATSIGGTLTGRGGDTIIIDDPLKPDDALSEVKRTGANNWFANTLLSRLDDKTTGAIIVVMQRVHMDDMTGFLLGQSDEWTVLSLPAIAESDQTIPLTRGRIHTRRPGDVLSPKREPREILDTLRLQIGSDAFYAQYQQSPVPPGGAMIKRHWIQRYKDPPTPQPNGMILQSWDTAAKGGPDNDYSVCTTWYCAPDCRLYLLDLWRGRIDYPTLKAKVVELARRWFARQVLIEEAGTAIALIEELRFEVAGLTGIKPDKDKVARMAIASARFEAGQIFLPEHASWLPELEAELFAFPGSKYDDQVDSVSQAILNERISELRIWTLLAPP
jgi:predicted phage terminase large subunit-like protein